MATYNVNENSLAISSDNYQFFFLFLNFGIHLLSRFFSADPRRPATVFQELQSIRKMVSQVEIVLKEIIKPSDPTPYNLKHLKLSFLDRLEGLSYVPLVLFYRNQWASGDDRAQRSQQLKQSLSETLNKFYPFAGRINGNVLVDCNDSGALFVEAQIHGDLSEAIQSAGTNKDIINQYLPLDIAAEPHGNDDKSNYFPLAVQSNFFQCGGIAIGLCVSHKIADMYTFATFMNAWAAKSSSSNGTVRPNFHIGSDHFPPIDIPGDKLENPSAAHDLLPGEEKIVSKRFVFDAETLAGMRKHLVSSRSDTPNPTRVETVSAFIWKHLIDVTRAKTATKRTFGAFHMVDLRRRISPPVPDAMGNLFVSAFARCELEKAGDYSDLVAPLRTAIRKDYLDLIKDEQKRSEYLDLLTRVEPEMGFCVFTSWCKFPFYQVDYGWGKPFAVCTTAQPFKNGVILMDTKCGDGIEAWISMAEDEMAMLPIQFLALENNDFSE